jgi:uncharacterized protein (DUF427 family)
VAPRAEQSGGRVLRPLFVVPKQGQESVWDYPRPPRLERVQKHVEIVFNDAKIVDALWCFRVLETSHPPVYYVSPESIAPNVLIPAAGSSVCEWKGEARYFDVVAGTRTAQAAAWCYWNPTYGFAELAGFVAFYARKMDRCAVDGETVEPQPGQFYGGWVTADIVGPFKGEPGSSGW